LGDERQFSLCCHLWSLHGARYEALSFQNVHFLSIGQDAAGKAEKEADPTAKKVTDAAGDTSHKAAKATHDKWDEVKPEEKVDQAAEKATNTVKASSTVSAPPPPLKIYSWLRGWYTIGSDWLSGWDKERDGSAYENTRPSLHSHGVQRGGGGGDGFPCLGFQKQKGCPNSQQKTPPLVLHRGPLGGPTPCFSLLLKERKGQRRAMYLFERGGGVYKPPSQIVIQGSTGRARGASEVGENPPLCQYISWNKHQELLISNLPSHS